MAASATDLFRKITNNFSTTLTSSIGSGDVTLSLASVTNLPTDTAIDLVIDRVDSTGTKTPTKREYVLGVVSGSNLISVVRGKGNSTAQAHASGAVVEYVFDQDVHNDLVTGVLNSMNQDGSLIGSAVRTALNQTAATGAGWTTLGYTPNTVVYNGNRSYTCTINATDATGTLSPGMRIQTTRTVTAPTKSTSLNGTTQYYSKTSPAGMTFTNNFVVSAWVKLSSYSGISIASRYDGNNGWQLQLNSSGQVLLSGYNGGAGVNYSSVTSYQSIPLNKWVHVAAQLDMSTFTATTTTSYVMIDGVDVPALVTRGGTNPTALVQAGSLNIGALNGANFFPGKIAQVAIYSAKVTQANIVATISQGLSGSETSLISAYSFNNAITDLNTTNANNLTANNGAVATNADSPFGAQADGTVSSTLDYGIITKISYSTNTTLVVQVPEGCTIPTTGGVSAVSYSTQKVPYGFPAQRGKWTIQSYYQARNNVAATSTSVWYNINNQLTIPIGEWLAYYSSAYQMTHAGTTALCGEFTLSNANNSASNGELNCRTQNPNTSLTEHDGQVTAQAPLSLAAQATYYLNFRPQSATTTIYTADSAFGYVNITAENAHL